MKRPTGVTVLAIVNLLEAVLLLLVAAMLWFLAWAFEQGAFAGPGADLPTRSAEVLRALAWLGERGLFGAAVGGLGAFAVFYLALGVGLWKLKNWARLGTLVLTGARIPLVLLGLVSSLPNFDLAGAVLELLMLFVYGWIVWYLLQPNVKQAFGVA